MAPLLNDGPINVSPTGTSASTRRLHASLLLLAGGRGSRMGGKNKLYLKVGGSFLIERTLNRIASLFQETILIVAPGESVTVIKHLAKSLDKWDVLLVEDREYGRGPLEGLYLGLSHMKEEWGFLLGCDMPAPQKEVIGGMYNFCGRDTDAVTAEIDGYLEPLHAFYRRTCKTPIDAAIARGDRKIKQFYDDVRLTVVKENILKKYGDYDSSFFNLNTPHDIEKMKQRQEVNSI